MPMTIAEHAAAYLREANASGQRGDFWSLDCGELQDLHEIYARSLEGKDNRLAPFERGIRSPRAVRERYAVLNALANTKSGKRLFECRRVRALYPGIVNGITRIFTLKEEFRV